MQKAGPNGNGIAGLAASLQRATPFLAAAGPNGYGGDASVHLATIAGPNGYGFACLIGHFGCGGHGLIFFAVIPFRIVCFAKQLAVVCRTVCASNFLAAVRDLMMHIRMLAGPNG